MDLHIDFLLTCVMLIRICTLHATVESERLHRVSTKYGDIEGVVGNVHFDGKTYQVAKFLGIPFAEAPVGDLRFRKPVPIQTLSTPFLAHSYGPACIQPDTPFLQGVSFSEDCLYLNIFTPMINGDDGSSSKPVMVYIHGGGFTMGSAHIYEGNVLSAYTGVIIVTIQYRLGPLGFFSTHDEHARGNYGVWDQQAAIQWVRDSIHSFGGDDSNITIFGMSAGASSVIYQLMYPGNDGLFKRAIAESGTISAWAVTTKDDNYNASMKFATTLGCGLQTHNEVMTCIRSKSLIEVKTAAAQIQEYTSSQVPVKWVPVYDGDFVVTEPETMLDEATHSSTNVKFRFFRNIDLLIGATNYDGCLLPWFLFGLLDYNINITAPDLKTKYIPRLISYIFKGNASKVSIDAILNEYKASTMSTDGMTSFIRMSTDAALNAPTVKTARAHRLGGQSETYMYQFAMAPPQKIRLFPLPSNLYDDPTAANHGEELVYVFGFDPAVLQLNKDFTSADIRPGDIPMSKLVMSAWTNFARSGNPNFPTSLRSMADVLWKPFNDDENYLEISPSMSHDSLKRRLAARGVAFWNNLLPPQSCSSNAFSKRYGIHSNRKTDTCVAHDLLCTLTNRCPG